MFLFHNLSIWESIAIYLISDAEDSEAWKKNRTRQMDVCNVLMNVALMRSLINYLI